PRARGGAPGNGRPPPPRCVLAIDYSQLPAAANVGHFAALGIKIPSARLLPRSVAFVSSWYSAPPFSGLPLRLLFKFVPVAVALMWMPIPVLPFTRLASSVLPVPLTTMPAPLF